MAEREQPDLDRVREALREHDERTETEETPPQRDGEDQPNEDDDGDGAG
jgi:hypothetical protein